MQHGPQEPVLVADFPKPGACGSAAATLAHAVALARRLFDVDRAEIWLRADGTPRLAMQADPPLADAAEAHRLMDEAAGRDLLDGTFGGELGTAAVLRDGAGAVLGLLCLPGAPLRTEADASALRALAELAAGAVAADRAGHALAEARSDVAAHEAVIQRQAARIAHDKSIFERASQVVRLGLWECELRDNSLRWSDGVYDIFELPRGKTVSREETLRHYPPGSQDLLESLRDKAIRELGGFRVDLEIVTTSGRRRWMRLTANVEAENGVAVRLFGMKQDVTEEKVLWHRTQYLAEYDPMTGLANRGLFQARLAGRGGEGVAATAVAALLLVDLDGFKQVNDTFGHGVGDECLRQVADRLRSVCGGAELVARLGGDEFAVLLGRGFNRDSALKLAGTILEAMRSPIPGSSQSFQLGASVGIAFADGAGACEPSELFTHADLALYAAKGAGRNTVRVFTPAMKQETERRIEVVRGIGRALRENELALYYQPKLRLADGGLAGFEALLRWRMPNGQVVAAGAFEAAFDDPELSRRLGRWVVEEAVRQAAAWHREGREFGHVAVNLSPSQLRDEGFAESLIERLAAAALPADRIEVEVTEGVILHEESGRVRRILERLKDHGVRVALDDFGTGYASLVHLRNYPIDTIKIDRSFVRCFLTSRQDRAILETLLDLGARLGMNIIAEGIETAAQLEGLLALHCPQGQGFLFSRPLTAEDAAQWHGMAAGAAYRAA